MKKNVLKLGLVATLITAGMASAYADNSAQVIVTGRVNDATCDINTQGLAGNKLDLGSHAPSAFSDATTLVGSKSFQVGLSNCSATESSGKHYGLYVSGDSLAGAPDLFADLPMQTVGIELQDTTGGTAKLVSAKGQFIPVGKDEKAASADGQSVAFKASMRNPSGTAPAIQDVKGTILFVADYQ